MGDVGGEEQRLTWLQPHLHGAQRCGQVWTHVMGGDRCAAAQGGVPAVQAMVADAGQHLHDNAAGVTLKHTCITSYDSYDMIHVI